MAKPYLALVCQSECADFLTFSDVAYSQLMGLPDVEQLRLSEGLARAYGKTVALLVKMKMNPYSSLEDNFKLNMIANRTITFEVDGYALRIVISSKDLRFHLESIGLPGSLKRFEIQSL